MKKYLGWLIALVLTLGVVGLFWGRTPDEKADPQMAQKPAVKEKKPNKSKKTAAKTEKRSRQKPQTRKMSTEHPYSPADKQLADSIQIALENEDFDATAAATSKALKSPNPDVRRDAVDALGWFGEKALAELTVWMADADEDVAQAAMDHWEQGVSELDQADERLQVSLYALNVLTDTDALTMIGSEFANAATELIDDEENEARASQKRTEIVQALVDMIEGDKPASAEAAREIYEDVTGNKWISVDEAEKYLRDPDNYEEPDE